MRCQHTGMAGKAHSTAELPACLPFSLTRLHISTHLVYRITVELEVRAKPPWTCCFNFLVYNIASLKACKEG